MNKIIFYTLVLILTGCADKPRVGFVDFCGLEQQSAEANKLRNDWNDIFVNQGYESAILKFGYPLNQSGKLTDKDIATEGGACGQEYTGFHSMLNLASKEIFDDFLEIDNDGTIINKWIYPYNMWVGAVEGDSIIVPYTVTSVCTFGEDLPRYDKALRISASGSLKLIEKKEYPKIDMVECPSNNLFKGSGYRACAIFNDTSSGEAHKRLFMFQSPCT